MEKYHRLKGETVTYKVKTREDAPLQQNGVDCGVILCQHAEKMARGGTLWLKDSDTGQTRKMMAEELLQGKIRDDWGNYHRSRAPVDDKE